MVRCAVYCCYCRMTNRWCLFHSNGNFVRVDTNICEHLHLYSLYSTKLFHASHILFESGRNFFDFCFYFVYYFNQCECVTVFGYFMVQFFFDPSFLNTSHNRLNWTMKIGEERTFVREHIRGWKNLFFQTTNRQFRQTTQFVLKNQNLLLANVTVFNMNWILFFWLKDGFNVFIIA